MVSNIFYFHPENWGNDPIWLIFSIGWLKPPTRKKNTIMFCKTQHHDIKCFYLICPFHLDFRAPTSQSTYIQKFMLKRTVKKIDSMCCEWRLAALATWWECVCVCVWRCYTLDGWNPANQLRLVVYPIIYRVSYIPGVWRCYMSPRNLQQDPLNGPLNLSI